MSAPEDLVVDERTCILLFAATSLAGGLGGTGLIEALLNLSLKYEACWVILEGPAHEPGCDYALLFASVSGFIHVGLSVRLLFSQGVEDTAMLIRAVGHLTRVRSHGREIWTRDQWCSREWLSSRESTVRPLRKPPHSTKLFFLSYLFSDW